MNISEWCKFMRDNENLSDEELAYKAWNFQKQQIRDFILQKEQEKLEAAAAKKIEQEIENNLDKAIEKAFLGGKSNMNISINI